MKKTLRIATRKSVLALWQANFVKDSLEKRHANLQVELVPMTTQGDVLLATPLNKIGGKGLFVKELETALLENRADIAVHCMKDVPGAIPEGLCINIIAEREDPRDAFVSNHYASVSRLPQAALIGSSSLRRQAQIKMIRPDLRVETLRGNVTTRLDKLNNNEFDAIILAAAGLKRLGRADTIREYFSTEQMVPPPGQGALGIECRVDDQEILSFIDEFHHEPTYQCVAAERLVNKMLGGSCQVPLGVHAEISGEKIKISARICHPNKPNSLSDNITGPLSQHLQLAESLAKKLIAQGAKEIMNECG